MFFFTGNSKLSTVRFFAYKDIIENLNRWTKKFVCYFRRKFHDAGISTFCLAGISPCLDETLTSVVWQKPVVVREETHDSQKQRVSNKSETPHQSKQPQPLTELLIPFWISGFSLFSNFC